MLDLATKAASRTFLSLLGLGAIALGAVTPAAGRDRFDTRVLAVVPDPGSVALTVLGSDRTIFGGTFFPAAGNAGDGTPSRVFAWSPDGRLLRTWRVEGQDTSADHGVQAAVIDARGDVYLLDTSPARVVVLDPGTGGQRTYATFPDLAPCTGTDRSGCSATTLDNPPEPDYAAWGPDGALYVTDARQATIFRVPPGGGRPEGWLTDPRFDAIAFGLTGLALAPDRRTLAVTTVGSNPTVDANPTVGHLFTIPIEPDGSPGTIRTLWTSGPLEAPDGFAFARSGNVYVALLGPLANQVVELSPQGEELARFPSAAQNRELPVPFDTPSSVVFDGERLLVTNDSYFAGDRSHQVILDVQAGEQGAPVYIPDAAAPRVSARGLAVRVRPRSVPAGRRVRLRIRVSVVEDGARRTPADGSVRLGGRGYHLPRNGRLSLRRRFARPGHVTVRVSVPDLGTARATITVRAPRG